MKNICPILFTVLAFATTANGANSSDSSKISRRNAKFILNFSVGPSIPFGSFSDAKFANQNGATLDGGAELGFHFDVSGDWYFSRYIGLTALLGGSINPFNSSAYNSSLDFGEPTTTTANPFYIGEYLSGLCCRFKINSKITIHFKFLVGDMEANYPNIKTSFPATSTQVSGEDILAVQRWDEFILSYDAGINYIVHNHLSLLVDVSYFNTTVRYPYSSLSQTLQGSQALTSIIYYDYSATSLYMSLGLLKPTVGICYSF